MFGFSQLEEQLNGENAPEVRAQTLKAVQEIGADISTALADGLSTEDADMAQSILGAVKASEHVLMTPVSLKGE